MNGSRRTFLAGVATLGVAVVRGPVDADPLPLRIGVLPGDISAQPYYAETRGIFRSAGLAATIQPFPANASTIIAAMVAGDIDAGYANVVTLATARGRGVSTVILAPANMHVREAPTAGILAVKGSSPIRTGADLNGKTVGVEGLNNIAQISALAWIDKNGGSSTSVKFIEVPGPTMTEAVVRGRVDAVVMNAIYDTTFRTPDDPLRRLGSTFDAIAPLFAPSVWCATPSWVAARRDAARAFARSMREAAEWANAHHAESAEILARYTGQTPAQINAVRRVTYGTALTTAIIQPPIDIAAKYGLIPARFPAAQLLADLS
jgi:NitT/TauT family transport system substrate-binding protein